MVEPVSLPLYGTFELALELRDVQNNPFTVFPRVMFAQGDDRFEVDAFYDGDSTWRARFMPHRAGAWTYAWSHGDAGGEGGFVCAGSPAEGIHGHLRVDPAHPRYLAFDDGSPAYWYGGKWFRSVALGPPRRAGVENTRREQDAAILAYLDVCREYRHNGLTMKTALYPLAEDRLSWDLEWVRRMDWFVQQAAARGIYVQVNLFDTWSRAAGAPFGNDTEGSRQVFNVWADGDEAAKENYLRYAVARFAGFANVWWELGNEMEHRPNSGDAFAARAPRYIEWIRRYDPYDLPVGLSEYRLALQTPADVIQPHQPGQYPPPDAERPWVMNEVVGPDQLWRDDAIRDSAFRAAYRRNAWRMFATGGSGASEATWLSIQAPLDEAVRDVMADQARLRTFHEALPVSINQMRPLTDFVSDGPAGHVTRAAPGAYYVTYFPEPAAEPGTLAVRVPAGAWRVRWYDPAEGTYSEAVTVRADAPGALRLDHPAWPVDRVLLLERL